MKKGTSNAAAGAMVVLLMLAGCISTDDGSGIKVKRLDVTAGNVSEMASLGVPIACTLTTSEGVADIRMMNGSVLAERGGLLSIKQGSMYYLKVPQERKAELGCDWVLVNESDRLLAENFYSLMPVKANLDALPGAVFDCDIAALNESEFHPAGHVCWYLDLVQNAQNG